MINRTIIRIKILQIVYAYYQKNSRDIVLAENELMAGIQKSYDLYHYLLLLIILLTDAEQKRLDIQKNRLLATEAERNPDRRFADNRLAEQLNRNEQLQKFAHNRGTFWNNEDSYFIRSTLNKIIQSDIYRDYLESDDTYESDRNFWVKILKDLILKDDELAEVLEYQSVYWNDDLEIIGAFALKTIRRWSDETPADQALYPMFRDTEDKDFAIQLLRHTLLEEEENNKRITNQINNWDIERLAVMDLYIIQIALAELRNFPSIPINVTLNEYIDLARYYSTPKSPVFINGILDAIVKELKNEKVLFKN
ncbi:MAG: transcription antitermination factor NusB [Candidatus Azobacteroides sp.]|nr:transcription antitermination factor NusB [Candidatus Azobacteroides sp.]